MSSILDWVLSKFQVNNKFMIMTLKYLLHFFLVNMVTHVSDWVLTRSLWGTIFFVLEDSSMGRGELCCPVDILFEMKANAIYWFWLNISLKWYQDWIVILWICLKVWMRFQEWKHRNCENHQNCAICLFLNYTYTINTPITLITHTVSSTKPLKL